MKVTICIHPDCREPFVTANRSGRGECPRCRTVRRETGKRTRKPLTPEQNAELRRLERITVRTGHH